MFIPKEIAPYLGMIAPMVAPQLGITGSLLLSQAGSWKERGGKWDPYSALATGIALSSPQARQIRAMGRMDPSQGTIGQKMSAGFGKSLNKANYGTANASGLQNWFDPTKTMKGGYSSAFLDSAQGKEFLKQNPNLWKDGVMSDKNWDKTTGAYKDWKYGKDAFADIKYTPAIEATDDRLVPDVKDEETGIWSQKKIEGVEGKDSEFQYLKHNLTPDEQDVYYNKYGSGTAGEVIDAKDYLEGLDKRAPGYDPGFWGQAGDFGSDLAGAIFPGWYDSYDPVTGRGQGGLNFSNVVQTITVAATLSSVMAIKDELEKEKDLDEAEERKIWKEWFDSYERTSGHTYEFSPYREEHLWEMYQKYMAKGGRVGYNLGGGIMEAPGVPQGMQLDGRDGAFVPQGIEEKADDVPAMLSKNEFVLTADAMRGLDKMMGGQGDPRAAAQHMYQMMDQLEAVA